MDIDGADARDGEARLRDYEDSVMEIPSEYTRNRRHRFFFLFAGVA